MELTRDYSYGLIPFYWNEDGTPRYFIGCSASGDKFWKFPKGHKEGDETDLEAAVRETAEEIGINIDESDVFTERSYKEVYTYTNKAGKTEKTNTYWLAEVDPDVVVKLNDEFSEHVWASFTEALELLPQNSQVFFEEVHEYLLYKSV